MANRLFLLRHGQTEWSVNGRHTGRTDIPLTPAGEGQARAAGATLRTLLGGSPSLVLSSPRTRARRTADLAGLRIDEVTEELGEWDYGDYEGVTTPTIRETVPGWTVWSHPIPGGESADEVGARADKLLDRVRLALGDGEVIMVGHGHFSRVLVARWLGLASTSGVHFGLDPASVTVLGDERGEPQIEHLNIPPIPED
ncbi:histidine phosphatase family protein [Amycolatopsis sp. H20-H5]|uniref:histidine phosphatase family protein n=1 Tax=Amycolatopsis sp. H20-H5 TaxID=3046309 RepID=UPI002DB5986E|nr:histidine phosphatase family protein [Amycolatopsis sp. H20-H5]MEC3980699.1 histidine phosphatase family protein [Amycolatopsis sp. H20-H5]